MNYVNEQIKTLIKKGIDQQKKYIIKLNFTTIENFEDEIGGSINDLWDYWQESFLDEDNDNYNLEGPNINDLKYNILEKIKSIEFTDENKKNVINYLCDLFNKDNFIENIDKIKNRSFIRESLDGDYREIPIFVFDSIFDSILTPEQQNLILDLTEKIYNISDLEDLQKQIYNEPEGKFLDLINEVRNNIPKNFDDLYYKFIQISSDNIYEDYMKNKKIDVINLLLQTEENYNNRKLKEFIINYEYNYVLETQNVINPNIAQIIKKVLKKKLKVF
tara:strand:+ start:129 stop:953 length:825 start_codon:yes stop_codon:yes gene_type:complete